jgi:hypothetical protein
MLDREVASLRRELDQAHGMSTDHDTRIRKLEANRSSLRDHERRITALEVSMRAVIWALAVVTWKLAPEIAANLLAFLPVRVG